MCFFFMLRGALPFAIEGSIRLPVSSYFQELLAKVNWDGMTQHACQLIQLCLSVDMRDRPSAQALVKNQFLLHHRRRAQRQLRCMQSCKKFSTNDEDEGQPISPQNCSPHDAIPTG